MASRSIRSCSSMGTLSSVNVGSVTLAITIRRETTTIRQTHGKPVLYFSVEFAIMAWLRTVFVREKELCRGRKVSLWRGREARRRLIPSYFSPRRARARRIATTRAIDECVITRLEKATMIAVIHNEPEFSELFMSYLLSRSSRIEEDLIDQLFNSSEKRLARVLLLLANFGKEGRPEPIIGKFSQETLAEMIGTTRSRVSFFMNKFRKLGFIEYNGKLEINNSLLNVVLYDKPEIRAKDD